MKIVQMIFFMRNRNFMVFLCEIRTKNAEFLRAGEKEFEISIHWFYSPLIQRQSFHLYIYSVLWRCLRKIALVAVSLDSVEADVSLVPSHG